MLKFEMLILLTTFFKIIYEKSNVTNSVWLNFPIEQLEQVYKRIMRPYVVIDILSYRFGQT